MQRLVYRGIGLLLIMLGIGGCNMQGTVDKAKQKLMDTDRAFAAYSVEHGAAEAFNTFLAPDAMELPARDNPHFGRDTIYQNMLKSGTDYVLDWEPQDGNVAISGEMGWTWGKYTLSYKDSDGVEHNNYGKYLNIWQRQPNGDWRVAVDMGNSSPAPE